MMITNVYLKVGSAAAVLGGCLLLVSGAEDWKQRLSGDGVTPEVVLVEATAQKELSEMVGAAAGLEGEALEKTRAVLERCLPGGDLAGALDEATQAEVVRSWTRAGGNAKAVGYRLWKIHQLSPSEVIKEAAREGLQGLPEAAQPEAFVAAMSQGAGGPIDPEKLARGKEVYMKPAVCFTCHQPNGMGIPGAFPPLAGSEWLDGDTERLIKIVLKGLMGEITVKGEAYNNVMTPLELMLNDQEIADVLTYVRNEWGNTGAEVTVEEVSALREKLKDRPLPYQAAELLKAHPLR
jgi:mono/diheme cytochrome c family protein